MLTGITVVCLHSIMSEAPARVGPRSMAFRAAGQKGEPGQTRGDGGRSVQLGWQLLGQAPSLLAAFSPSPLLPRLASSQHPPLGPSKLLVRSYGTHSFDICISTVLRSICFSDPLRGALTTICSALLQPPELGGRGGAHCTYPGMEEGSL